MSEALWQKSAVDVAAGIRQKQFSCSDVMAPSSNASVR